LSDVRISKSRGFYARSSNIDVAWLDGLVGQTIEEARAEIEGIDTIVSTRVEVLFEMHYKLQTHEIMVPAALPGHGEITLTEAAVESTLATFHDIHEKLFSFKKPEQEVELLGLQVDIRGIKAKRREALSTQARPTGGAAAPSGSRPVYFEELGRFEEETALYEGRLVGVGHVVEGPAVVEEPHTTIVVHPGMSLHALDESLYALRVR
jgi:N-methylhydantoinase A